MNYLTDIPGNVKDFGFNKLLITRSLTIDWKHKDSEIYLRNPQILDQVSKLKLNLILQNRSNQLRFIYKIPRNYLENEDSNNLICYFKYLNTHGFDKFIGNIYLDFKYIKDVKNLNKCLIERATVFSFNIKQRDMIKYISKYLNGTFPYKIIYIDPEEKNEFYKLLSKNLSLIIYSPLNKFITNEDKLFMWLSNFYLYEFNELHFSRVNFKTDSNLQIPFQFK